MTNYQSVIDLLKEMSGQKNTMTIPRIYIKITGDIIAGVFLSQLVWYSDKGKRADGWFWKKNEEWEEEIDLSYAQVKRCTKTLEEMGLIETKVMRANAAPTTHYRVNMEAVVKSILDFLENRKGEETNLKKVENQNLEKVEKHEQHQRSIDNNKDGASPEAPESVPNSRKADDFLPPAETQMKLLFSSLTNPDGGPRYDQAEKDLLASGWNIRSKPIKDATIHFLAATGWEVPKTVSIRRDWIKSLEEHITEFGLAGLYAMYSEVIQTATHRLSRPGSFTKAMAAIKNARSSDRKHVADDWMDDPQYQTFAALPETEEVSWAAFLNPANER